MTSSRIGSCMPVSECFYLDDKFKIVLRHFLPDSHMEHNEPYPGSEPVYFMLV